MRELLVLVACWSVKGGVGTSVVSAGVAAAGFADPDVHDVLVVDLGGDLPALYGLRSLDSAGIAGWLRAGVAVPDDALGRLEVVTLRGLALLPRGDGPLDPARGVELARMLADDPRLVVVDVGTAASDDVGLAVIAAADRSVLVTRACPLAQRRLAALPAVPDGVVVVRDHRRTLRWPEIGVAAGAPVLAELDVDPAVGAAVDRGLDHHRLPRRFLAALSAVR